MPSVSYVLMRHSEDPERAIVTAVSDALDNDTIGAIVGAAVGVLHGESGLPQHWIANLPSRTAGADGGRIFELLDRARRFAIKQP